MSLIQSVKVLNTTRDLSTVLQQLIQEVLTLIDGATASVLFLYDEQLDELYAKSAIGFDIEALRHVRLRPGEGMSGQTFLSRESRIFSSSKDTREGMANLSKSSKSYYTKALGYMKYPRSAISAPLFTTDHQCIGVLTVDIFNENRHFNQEDLDLFNTFASQASIALENAKLFSQNERTAEIHEGLSKVSLAKGELSEVTKELAALIQRPVAVFNDWFDILASSDRPAQLLAESLIDEHSQETMNSHLNSREPSVYRTQLQSIDYSFYFFPIFSDDFNLGNLAIAVKDQEVLDPLDQFAVQQATTIFAFEIDKRERDLAEDFKYSGSILEQLIHAPYDKFSTTELAMLNFPEKKNHRYILASIFIKDPLLPFSIVRIHKQALMRLIYRKIGMLPSKTLVYERNMEVALLFTNSGAQNEEKVLSDLQNFLLPILQQASDSWQLDCYVGVGPMVVQLSDVHLSYRDARLCVQYLQNTDYQMKIMNYQELGPFRLFLKMNRDELEEYTYSLLRPLLLYDKQHHSELVATLKAYIAKNHNMTASAKQLYVHVNTVKYRLKTIKELLSVERLDGRLAFELQLALHILDYLAMSDSRLNLV